MNQTLLELQGLSVGYSDPLIEDINLSIKHGEVIAIAVSYTHLTLPTKA